METKGLDLQCKFRVQGLRFCTAFGALRASIRPAAHPRVRALVRDNSKNVIHPHRGQQSVPDVASCFYLISVQFDTKQLASDIQ